MTGEDHPPGDSGEDSTRYKVELSPAAARFLRRLQRGDTIAAKRIMSQLRELADDPRPANVSALKERPGELRVRAGNYRIIYEVHDGELIVLVLAIGHRSAIYD